VIVIDTHVLLWWANSPHLLSKAADEAVTNADAVAVSAITAWEIAVLHRRRRIEMSAHPLPWMRDLEERRDLRVLPVLIEIATLAASLHETLRDPIDCLIAATALTHGVPLVTKDERIQRSGVVATIW
jgi:PIN domain nuclease of toxin-antitoxin system